jgi:hypothetical protein
LSSCRYAARLARAHADNAAQDLVAGDERVLGRSPDVLSLNRLPIGDISIADDQVRIFKIIADNLIRNYQDLSTYNLLIYKKIL